jgi:hypothetical protein
MNLADNLVVVGAGAVAETGVALTVLKLCGVIHWSWLWVTAPFWGSIGLLVMGLGLAIVAAVILENYR